MILAFFLRFLNCVWDPFVVNVPMELPYLLSFYAIDSELLEGRDCTTHFCIFNMPCLVDIQ